MSAKQETSKSMLTGDHPEVFILVHQRVLEGPGSFKKLKRLFHSMSKCTKNTELENESAIL
ncbi:hypothetical protein ACTXT7_002762 [Hymenolepis weldensis]